MMRNGKHERVFPDPTSLFGTKRYLKADTATDTLFESAINFESKLYGTCYDCGCHVPVLPKPKKTRHLDKVSGNFITYFVELVDLASKSF